MPHCFQDTFADNIFTYSLKRKRKVQKKTLHFLYCSLTVWFKIYLWKKILLHMTVCRLAFMKMTCMTGHGVLGEMTRYSGWSSMPGGWQSSLGSSHKAEAPSGREYDACRHAWIFAEGHVVFPVMLLSLWGLVHSISGKIYSNTFNMIIICTWCRAEVLNYFYADIWSFQLIMWTS